MLSIKKNKFDNSKFLNAEYQSSYNGQPQAYIL